MMRLIENHAKLTTTMENSASIMQWNIQGARSKKDELSEWIKLYKANIVALQETNLWNNTKFTIPHYSELRKDGYYNRGPHGGVAIYIHTSILYNSVEITTPLQAVAVRVQLHVTVTICNIYSPGSQALNQQQLTDIYNQLL